MNHRLDTKKYCLAQLGVIKLYVSSYEVSRDRRYAFHNCVNNDIYFSDNGSLPAYLKLKGYILKAECATPCVIFNQHMEVNMRYFLDMDGMFFNAARLKKYNVVTDTESQIIKCEMILCCDSTMTAITKEV